MDKALSYKSLDIEADNFHYAKDFLEIVTIAIAKWITNCVGRSATQDSITNWLSSIKNNRVRYELAYACIHYFIPYWEIRSAIKWNKVEEMETWWRYWIHLFHATRKKHYTLLSIRFLWILRAMAPEVREVYEKYNIFSFSGDEGTGIPADEVVELVSICSK